MKHYSQERKPFQVLKSERIFQGFSHEGDTLSFKKKKNDNCCLVKKAQGRYDFIYGRGSELDR